MILPQIKNQIRSRIQDVFNVTELNTPYLEYPSSEFGDIAIPCFTLAKTLRRSPYSIARDLIEHLSFDWISDIKITGGYVNIQVNSSYIAQHLQITLPTVDSRETIALEYASPNTNKPLHLGHLRNIALGQALKNLLESKGHQVITTQIINDRGIAMAKVMLMYDKFYSEVTPEIKSDHFVGMLYREFEIKSDLDPSLISEAQEVLSKWEAGDPHWREVWSRLRNWALKGMALTYQKIHQKFEFDENIYESDIYTKGKDIVVEGLSRGIFHKHSEGYIYADLEEMNLPNKILLRSGGTALYITQDLALIHFRLYGESRCKGADKIIYITAFEQNTQFEQLFAIARQLGVPDHTLYHIGYGLVVGPEGKMSSRKGTVVQVDDQIVLIEDLIRDSYFKESSLELEEQERRVHIIARASYMYSMLATSAKKDIVFNPKEAILLTGKTGPYLLYTYARLRSILAKAPYQPLRTEDYDYQAEHALLVNLLKFHEYRDGAVEHFDPAIMLQYLSELAEDANSYYHKVPILSADQTVMQARLFVIDHVSKCLKKGLNLLSIPILESM